ncbi:hypothetical protein [Synechococcus sp. BIOS-E4-1]|uniref:hypothetical protein n=1 Tax=Synechococcus sp. BIOS-E4-1 TaxID=1400864 RepID=UPI002105B5E5|nr:hypothetical protein [Synechococcus sp. BIOS-E4-1]
MLESNAKQTFVVGPDGSQSFWLFATPAFPQAHRGLLQRLPHQRGLAIETRVTHEGTGCDTETDRSQQQCQLGGVLRIHGCSSIWRVGRGSMSLSQGLFKRRQRVSADQYPQI